MLELLVKAVSAVAIATISSWITVHLSRNKFRTERWWERKVLAYERVIDAFHKSKKFYSEHLRAEELALDMDEERRTELKHQAREARDDILRASDIGSFILSQAALGILAKYEAESESMGRKDFWYEYLDCSWSITDQYMKQFIAAAHADLGSRA